MATITTEADVLLVTEDGLTEIVTEDDAGAGAGGFTPAEYGYSLRPYQSLMQRLNWS